MWFFANCEKGWIVGWCIDGLLNKGRERGISQPRFVALPGRLCDKGQDWLHYKQGLLTWTQCGAQLNPARELSQLHHRHKKRNFLFLSVMNYNVVLLQVTAEALSSRLHRPSHHIPLSNGPLSPLDNGSLIPLGRGSVVSLSSNSCFYRPVKWLFFCPMG